MDLQDAFDAGFVAVKSYVDMALAEQARALPGLITAAVAQAVSALPVAKDGEPGRDGEAATAEQIGEAVKSYLAANPPAAGDDGQPGTDADMEAVKAMVAAAVAALPPAQDGKDADPDFIKAMVEEAVAALPPPRDGADGLNGADGKDGQGVTVEDVAPVIERAVEAVLASLERPKDGRDGIDGKDGADGRDGTAGAAGVDGKDGIGLAGALIDKDGALVVTLTDGTMRKLGLVVGRDGDNGAKGDPGRDGLQLTGFDTALSEDGRTLTLSLENEELKVTHQLQLPVMIYRGVFTDGETYVQGDTVTFGGSLWHCNAETTEKPLEGRGCWQLATRKGRDGKDAKP